MLSPLEMFILFVNRLKICVLGAPFVCAFVMCVGGGGGCW